MTRTVGGRDQMIADLCEQAIENRVFPGCQVGYVMNGIQSVATFGHLTYESTAPSVTAHTVYDVASITKSVPTSSVILKLAEEGKVALDDKVAMYVPELANTFRDQILVRHLLTFTVLFQLTDTMANVARKSPAELLNAILTAPVETRPGEKYVYTNAPSMLLGMIAERICSEPLDEIAHRMFFGPLKMMRTTFHAGSIPAEEVAPSTIDWRDEVRGKVHDPGAWALYHEGRVPGHAGLFSTAPDLLKFTEMLLNGGMVGQRQFFEADTVQLMHTNQIPTLENKMGLGWSIANPVVMGTSASDQVFGKTGFTGTMILIDPVKKRSMAVLSNRTFPRTPESYGPMRSVWRGLADIVFAD